MSFETLFVKEHDFGTVCGIRIPQDEVSDQTLSRLHPEEASVLQRFKRSRRSTWVGGRLALAQACLARSQTFRPILNDDRGAPILPDGLTGSLTHKNNLAIAIVAPAEESMRLGIDVESLAIRQPAIERMILTQSERAVLKTLDDSQKALFLVRTFSLKESIYKAVDPFVRRYVGFKEVEIVETQDGFNAHFQLKNQEGPFRVELRSEEIALEDERLVLTSAKIYRA